MSLSNVLFKWLKIRYWGVGFENDLPPEFVITNHAKLRLDKRLAYPHKNKITQLMLEAWYDGEETPDTFKKDKGHKPKKTFSRFVYKYYEGYIWIWGVNKSELIPDGQKYLITIYNWRK